MDESPVKLITNDLLDRLEASSKSSTRLRVNHNLHPILEDPVQRFLNAMQPGTYVRPHRHIDPSRWELFLLLQGSVVLLLFNDDGVVQNKYTLEASGPVRGIEIAPGQWHALAAIEPSILYESKQGPYHQVSDKHFAGWAPSEGEANSSGLVDWYLSAQIGDYFSGKF